MSTRRPQEDVQRLYVEPMSLELNVYIKTRDINLGFISTRVEFKTQIVGEIS